VESRDQILAWLRSEIGLDPQSIGASALDRVLRERQRSVGVGSFEAYAALVKSSPAERVALLDSVVVPETWFFRDTALFDSIGEMMARARENRGGGEGEPIRWLSLPCATGEEAYSIAMALIQKGFAPGSATVTGVDLSQRCVESAGRGLYGKNSFRGDHLGYRERFFERHESVHRLSDEVRRWVRFRCANILGDGFSGELGIFDVVFCRNMLIYFDDASRARAAGVLRNLVRPGGFLCLTPAESHVAAGQGFAVAEGFPHSIFRRELEGSGRASAPIGGVAAASRLRVGKEPLPVARVESRFVPAPRKQEPMVVSGGSTSEDRLAMAAVAADRGELDLAESLCIESNQKAGPTAQAYYLLGLVQDARGRNGEAESSYRKAIYMDPRHYEALVHLAALLGMRGEQAESGRLMQRAMRVKSG